MREGHLLHLEVVVPVLNEEKRLEATIDSIGAYLSAQSYEAGIAIVDNGSVDRSTEVVDAAHAHNVPIRLIGCAVRGKGAAVRRGVMTSRARYVGFCDADLATPIETLGTILPLLEAGSPVVVGSRRCPGAVYEIRQSVKRRIASQAFHYAVRVCTSGAVVLDDTQCGFKFFDRMVAQRLFAGARANGFAFDVEILALASLHGIEVVEHPVAWRDQTGSTLRMSKEANEVLSDLLALRQTVNTTTASLQSNAAPSY